MVWMRAMLGDRLFGGGLAVLLAYVLLLQGLVAAVGQGLMAAGGDGVICTPSGLVPVEPRAPATPELPAHGCCLALCQAMGGLAPALPATSDSLPLHRTATGKPLAWHGRSAPVARAAARPPEARGPPARA